MKKKKEEKKTFPQHYCYAGAVIANTHIKWIVLIWTDEKYFHIRMVEWDGEQKIHTQRERESETYLTYSFVGSRIVYCMSHGYKSKKNRRNDRKFSTNRWGSVVHIGYWLRWSRECLKAFHLQYEFAWVQNERKKTTKLCIVC